MSRQRYVELQGAPKANDVNIHSNAAKPERKKPNKRMLAVAIACISILAFLFWPENMERCVKKAAKEAQGSNPAFYALMEICRKKHTR